MRAASHGHLIRDSYGTVRNGNRTQEADLNRRMLMIVTGLVAVVVLALSGAAIARATGAFDDGEGNLAGPQADNAKAAALKITGGGKVNAVERDSEKGATYEVEVTRPDGSTVDVRLDAAYKLVVVDGDSESNDSDSHEGE
jgi:hypothetical protein